MQLAAALHHPKARRRTTHQSERRTALAGSGGARAGG
jgi:hypothetical protein